LIAGLRKRFGPEEQNLIMIFNNLKNSFVSRRRLPRPRRDGGCRLHALQGREAARLASLNALAAAQEHVGDLNAKGKS
jgi:hypothetical protein